MRVLHVAPSYFPAIAWGGPIHSTKAICDGLARSAGVELSVLTTDAAGPALSDRLPEGGTSRRLPGGYDVFYARRRLGHSIAPGLLLRLPAAVRRADLVHLTATYSFPTLPTLALARLMGKPVVWSPRGALQATAEWGAAPRQRLKHLFERAIQTLRPKGTVLLVTSETEAAQSTARLSGIRTAVVPVSVPLAAARIHPARRAETRLMFLSRLHPKKGLERLFAAMEHLPESFRLDIYGEGDSAYVEALRLAAAPLGPRVAFHGHVGGLAKEAAFLAADLFVLPTHSENFGIAVAEALAHGVPVITTTETPWGGLDAEGCGRCVDLAREDLAEVIAATAASDLAAMGRRGRDWIGRDFSAETESRRILDVYSQVLSRTG